MRPFKDFSINTKLTLLVVVAAGVAMLLACGAFAVNDYLMIRRSKVRQLLALAEVLGSNSTAALDFDDPATAAELLSSLREQPTIHFACLYDARGNVFAEYRRDPQEHFTVPLPGKSGYEFAGDGYLNVTREIVEDGERIGTIFLHAGMSDLYRQLFNYVNIVVVVMIVSLGASVLLSVRLQRAISAPILCLAGAAQRISAGADYSIRVEKRANDELGMLYDEFNGMLDRIQRGEQELQQARDQLEIRVRRRTRELSEANLELSREIAERTRAETELEQTHQQLVDTARQAGMAEIATGVLHNVGNVLNSVNISATLVVDRLKTSKLSDLTRAIELMNRHQGDLVAFISEDHKGKLLPGFLTMLSVHLNQERQAMLKELQTLTTNIDHVKTIVSMQQSYAGVSGLDELCSLTDLVEDALKINSPSFEKYGVEVIRRYDRLPRVRVERQKLLQILVNLITNAKDALVESSRSRRQLTVRVARHKENRVRIEIADNGIGIPKENLTRIFSHGFTTKSRGHGFGLHASANAASEMNGSLTARSDGPHRGAAFVVEFPFQPMQVAAIKGG